MPVLDAIASSSFDIVEWRRAIHANPELGFEEHRTSRYVADLLRSFGVDEVHEGIARTGVVGIIRSGSSDRRVGLRADMDALPMEEGVAAADRPHRSTASGRMHACGHDGHTAMLLGAARYLASERAFDGTVVLVFQPAEEVLDFCKQDDTSRGGAVAMLKAGLLERFPVDAMFGMHNRPGLPAGSFHSKAGPAYAAVDRFEIFVEGKGGHAARPHQCLDPVTASAQLILTLQTIASRVIDPFLPVVVSVCQTAGGTNFNIIPDTVHLTGTVRAFDEGTRKLVQETMHRICDGTSLATGCVIRLDYQVGHPALQNDASCVDIAMLAAEDVSGEKSAGVLVPQMGGEDFAHFANVVPAAYMVIGNGTEAPHGNGLHSSRYDFNDDILPVGAAYWVRVVERALPGPI